MVDDIKAFFAQPFRTDQNAFHWFLFLGFVLVCFAIWRITFSHIEG